MVWYQNASSLHAESHSVVSVVYRRSIWAGPQGTATCVYFPVTGILTQVAGVLPPLPPAGRFYNQPKSRLR